MYRPVTPAIVDALCHIVGPGDVLVDAEALQRYSHDETVGLWAQPEVVARATSTEQVSQVLKLAQRERIPVTPRGAGYGLSGGAVAVRGGIVLSTEKMNRILEIDPRNLMVTVEPGVITGDIHRAVEAEGLFYPPDPASLDSCSIGGNVAEGAGGPRAVKYGTTRDYVCGLEAVLPSGEIVALGGRLVGQRRVIHDCQRQPERLGARSQQGLVRQHDNARGNHLLGKQHAQIRTDAGGFTGS